MGFVPAGAGDPSYGETAALLLALTAEMGFHVREVKTVTGGFEVPDDVWRAMDPQAVPIMQPSLKTAPPGWDDPLPEVDIEVGEDGKVYASVQEELNARYDAENAALAEAGVETTGGTWAGTPELNGPVEESETDRESIRAWARENGHDVADKGRLKQTVIDAYLMAQAE